MTDDDRIIDELRAALKEGAGQLPSTPPPFGQVTASPDQRDASGRWRLLTVAAAAIVVASGTAVIVGNSGNGGESRSATTQPAVGGAAETSARRSSAVSPETRATALQDEHDHPELEYDFSTPCPAPDRGWRPPPPSTWMIDGELVYPGPAEGAAMASHVVEGYGGSWWDGATGVLNIRVVGGQQSRNDAAEAIKEYYVDPVCMVASTRTWEELQQIHQEVVKDYFDFDGAPVEEVGLTDLGAEHPSAVVSVRLRAPDPGLADELRGRYSDAIVIEPTVGPAGPRDQIRSPGGLVPVYDGTLPSELRPADAPPTTDPSTRHTEGVSPTNT